MIRGSLLDVGDTLTTPIGGRWNPRVDFEDTLADSEPVMTPPSFSPQWPPETSTSTKWRPKGGGDRDDYHRAVLEVLNVTAAPDLLAALDRPLRFDQIFEVSSDVRPALTTLKQWGLALATVADVGPGARKAYEEFGWTGFFSAYAISAEVGCCKPDPRMYRTASDALGLEPSEMRLRRQRTCLRPRRPRSWLPRLWDLEVPRAPRRRPQLGGPVVWTVS